MKFYLSSFKFGDKKAQIKQLAPTDSIWIIPNALDFRIDNDENTVKSIENKIMRLKEIGLNAENLDLKQYFGNQTLLKSRILEYGAVFVMGGNVFVLRQAMKLSGLDDILVDLHESHANFLYSGYSAAGCVLAPSLKPYQVVGDATKTPYAELDEVIWEGLGLVDFAFMPHYKSNHPESDAIDRGIEYCVEHNIKYKAVSDGEVIVITS